MGAWVCCEGRGAAVGTQQRAFLVATHFATHHLNRLNI